MPLPWGTVKNLRCEIIILSYTPNSNTTHPFYSLMSIVCLLYTIFFYITIHKKTHSHTGTQPCMHKHTPYSISLYVSFCQRLSPSLFHSLSLSAPVSLPWIHDPMPGSSLHGVYEFSDWLHRLSWWYTDGRYTLTPATWAWSWRWRSAWDPGPHSHDKLFIVSFISWCICYSFIFRLLHCALALIRFYIFRRKIYGKHE